MDIFGGLFDLNHDGKTDPMEMGLAFGVLQTAMEEEEQDEENELLDLTGYDSIDLELMDEEERREILEDAGLDPDDYDL